MLSDTSFPCWFFPFLMPLFLGLFAVGVPVFASCDHNSILSVDSPFTFPFF